MQPTFAVMESTSEGKITTAGTSKQTKNQGSEDIGLDVIGMIDDHLRIEAQVTNQSTENIEVDKVTPGKTWEEAMSEEDIPSKEMRRLSVEDKKKTSNNPAKGMARDSTPKRPRYPSPHFQKDLESDSDDLEFQVELTRQKRRVNREVAILKDMMEEEEKRMMRRQEKRRRIDSKIQESLQYVEQYTKKDTEKGGVKTPESSQQ